MVFLPCRFAAQEYIAPEQANLAVTAGSSWYDRQAEHSDDGLDAAEGPCHNRSRRNTAIRLRLEESSAIVAAARLHFGEGTIVWLFGSRADDRRRGGDIDLLIAPGGTVEPADALARKIRFLADLERDLGERRIDVLVERPGDDRPIVQVARETGILL